MISIFHFALRPGGLLLLGASETVSDSEGRFAAVSKPTRLSEPEMQLNRLHADAGADTVALIGFDGDVAEIIRQHHDRLDGSGYHGLIGSQILPGARVLAVADVMEAMVSHRPYRPGLPIEMALKEIEDGAGSRYDVKISEIALSLIREHRFEFSL